MQDKLKEIMRSPYGDNILEWIDAEIEELAQPEKIPSDKLTDVKAHKKILSFLKDKRSMLERLKEQESSENFGEYE